MKIEFSASGMVLGAGQLLSLDDAVGVRIASQGGSVWITQDGDPRDIVLRAGESFELDRATAVIVQAIDAAVVTIAEPVGAPRRWPGFGWARPLRAAARHFAMGPAWA